MKRNIFYRTLIYVKRKIVYLFEILPLLSTIREKKGDRAFLFVSPDTGNLGDHLIAYSAINLITNDLGMTLAEISIQQYRYWNNFIKSFISCNDILFINGGGFIGDLWMQEENNVNDIIKSFPNNRIVILPQTFYFSDTECGREEMEICRQLYHNCSNLAICVRDKRSYELLINQMRFDAHKVFLQPDLALLLNKFPTNGKRSKGIVCLREDKESLLKEEIREKITNVLQLYTDKIIQVSTITKKPFDSKKRIAEIKKFADMLSTGKYVITDRLHCMIFCYLTNTPCIVLDNLSHKVLGVYEWIKDAGYIKLLSVDDNLEENLKLILSSIELENKANLDFSQYHLFYKLLLGKGENNL